MIVNSACDVFPVRGWAGHSLSRRQLSVIVNSSCDVFPVRGWAGHSLSRRES